MTAAPRPQTDESPDSEAAEGWALLDGLRRRLDEQANQNRKTQNEVRQLAESIAAMVTQQRKRSRWLNVNSFAAYLIFTLLCGGAFYFLYQGRARELVADRNRVITSDARWPSRIVLRAVSIAPSMFGGLAANMRRHVPALVMIPDSGWLTSCAIEAVNAPRLITLATRARSDWALSCASSAKRSAVTS